MIEWVTLTIAVAACLLAWQGVAYYKKDRERIIEFFEEARPVIQSIKEKADDDEYMAQIAGKALQNYIPPEVMFDMAKGVAQHCVEGSLPYAMDRIEASIPNLIASAFSSDLARDLQSKSVAARTVADLGSGTKGTQALQFGLQKLLGGINIPVSEVIQGYQALKELQAISPSRGEEDHAVAGGVVIDYGLPSASEVGRA